MPARLINYTRMKFLFMSHSWELQLYVNKREAKFTLLIVQPLLLYCNCKYLFFCRGWECS